MHRPTHVRCQVHWGHQESRPSETYIRNAINLDSILHISAPCLPAGLYRAPDRPLARVFSKVRVSHLAVWCLPISLISLDTE